MKQLIKQSFDHRVLLTSLQTQTAVNLFDRRGIKKKSSKQKTENKYPVIMSIIQSVEIA